MAKEKSLNNIFYMLLIVFKSQTNTLNIRKMRQISLLQLINWKNSLKIYLYDFILINNR